MKYCVDFKVCDQQQLLSPSRKTNDAVQFILAFTSQISADIVSKELKNLILKVHTTIQPVYVSRKNELISSHIASQNSTSKRVKTI